MNRSPNDDSNNPPSVKRHITRKKKIKNLISKLNEVALNDSSLSTEIQELKNDIKDLTNLD